MKKQFLTSILFTSLLFTACDSNDSTSEPVSTDEDRVLTQLDQNNPVVVGLYNDFHMGLLYNYDNIKDFAYTASTAAQAKVWASIEIPTIASNYSDSDGNIIAGSEAAYNQAVTDNIDFLNEKVFKYFKPNTKIAALMPYKVLLASSIYAPNGVTVDSYFYTESESRISSSSTTVGERRNIFNAHSIVFSADDDLKVFADLPASTVRGGGRSNYTRDNFYVLLCKIFKMHNLVDDIPATFFQGKDAYYGKLMSTVYGAEQGYTTTQISNLQVIPKDWFFSKGFIDGYYFMTVSGLPTTTTQNKDVDGTTISPSITHRYALRPTYNFVDDKFEDVRSYIAEMIHRTDFSSTVYPANVRANIVLLRDLLMSWGVDIVAINPALATVTAN